VNTYANEGFYDLDFLGSQIPYFENEYIRHIRFAMPLSTFIDGKKNIGVILKPGEFL